MNKFTAMVREFHQRFGQPTGEDGIAFRLPDLRAKLIEEEAQETTRGLQRRDMIQTIDGCADTLFVVHGTLVNLGVDIDPIFDEVWRTNMAKEGGATRKDGKILQPPGWKPPRIRQLLLEQGWVPQEAPVGTHKHYKGAYYEVTSTVTMADDGMGHNGVPMVLYENSKKERFVRSAREFCQIIEWPDGKMRPRFAPCGVNGEMIEE